jgi:HTH-type transcriptional regulator, competence development regulator
VESIKQTRKRRGMSLTELAEASGVHRMAIARAERAGTDVRASTLMALAKALRVPVCELFPKEAGHGRRKRQAAP